MTREAFSGTLDIFNGHPTDPLDSLTVNILITDPDGVPSNGLFQINTEQLTNLSDVTGTGLIPSQEPASCSSFSSLSPALHPRYPYHTVSVVYHLLGSYNEEERRASTWRPSPLP